MKYFKSHFRYTRKERNGIFLLLLIILAIQVIKYNYEPTRKQVEIDPEIYAFYQKKIDSAKAVAKQETAKINPFNPNYISDYKGYVLGMSNEEIDRLLAFRARDKWVNSASEFQNVTGVSDSLLNSISPYFKFPEWISNPRKKSFKVNNFNVDLPFDQKQDLNTATAKDLEIVYGIGPKLSQRIINYRRSLKGGFVSEIQLEEVYGLTEDVVTRIKQRFAIKSGGEIIQLNLNLASVEQLVTLPYIDYELAHEIIDQRTLREGFKSLDELTKVKDFPLRKFEIIKLYLTLD